jgi:hypothetical protein
MKEVNMPLYRGGTGLSPISLSEIVRIGTKIRLIPLDAESMDFCRIEGFLWTVITTLPEQSELIRAAMRLKTCDPNGDVYITVQFNGDRHYNWEFA